MAEPRQASSGVRLPELKFWKIPKIARVDLGVVFFSCGLCESTTQVPAYSAV